MNVIQNKSIFKLLNAQKSQTFNIKVGRFGWFLRKPWFLTSIEN